MRRMISLENDTRQSQNGPLNISSKLQKEETKEFILPEINKPMISTNYNQRFGLASQSPLNNVIG